MPVALLESTVAIITGAAAGFGKAMAKAFLAAGAKVVLVDINASLLSSTVSELGSHAHGIQGDVSSPASVQSIVDQTIEKFGKLDILVNNAGVMDNYAPVGDVDLGLWEKVMGVNLTGPMLLSRAAVRLFLGREEGRGGVILNVSSISGLFGHRAGVAYTTSKHALIGFTKNTAAAYHKKHIRCNVICPGAMPGTNILQTASQRGVHEEGQKRTQATMSMEPNLCDVDDVANLAVFLCSDGARTVSGAVVSADGGWGAF